MTNDEIIEQIKTNHRFRRYWMKAKAKLDRQLEAFVRIEYTKWPAAESEAERKKEAAVARSLIKDAKAGDGTLDLLMMVQTTMAARAPANTEKLDREKTMKKLATALPVKAWIKSVYGADFLGLATIVAEAGGSLDRFPNVAKLWSRLGYAPYDGHAGSTWKRDTWRPRALTKEEWTEHPFSGERYGMMRSIADSLFRAQWIGAKNDPDGEGKPDGPYGEIYAKRRAHTAVTHPDWTKGHSHSDALRIMFKCFLADLWEEWNNENLGHRIVVPPRDPAGCAEIAAADQSPVDAHEHRVGGGPS